MYTFFITIVFFFLKKNMLIKNSIKLLLCFQFVSTTFWSLWFIDRSLVMPKDIDQYFPNWLNHTMHTFVFVFACLEMITAYRPYPSRVLGMITHLCLQLSYLIW
jgi:hypothetical protein